MKTKHQFATNVGIIGICCMLCACTIKRGSNEYNFMQMQTREGSASIYSKKVYGFDGTFPIPGTNMIVKLTLGYVSSTESLTPIKEDGELPNVLIDLSTTHSSNSNDLSDTYATGDASLSIYPEETTDLPPLK
jgi:hypothetical protein